MHFQKVLLDKIDEVQMQLQNIDTVKLDYKSDGVKFVANPRQKSVNHLSMYGSATIPAKSTTKSSTNRMRLTGNQKEIKAQAVSSSFSCMISFEFKCL